MSGISSLSPEPVRLSLVVFMCAFLTINIALYGINSADNGNSFAFLYISLLISATAFTLVVSLGALAEEVVSSVIQFR